MAHLGKKKIVQKLLFLAGPGKGCGYLVQRVPGMPERGRKELAHVVGEPFHRVAMALSREHLGGCTLSNLLKDGDIC